VRQHQREHHHRDRDLGHHRHLVGNAVKYNCDGGAVTIRGAVKAGWLRLDVADTGIGIREENPALLWDKFFGEKRAETRELEGNGSTFAVLLPA
jgi:two-component system phosphate regulon sensor histidine kinase PhoR